MQLRQAENRAVTRAGDSIPRLSQSPSFLQQSSSLSVHSLGIFLPPDLSVVLSSLLFCFHFVFLTCPPTLMASWKQLVSQQPGKPLPWSEPNHCNGVYAAAFLLADRTPWVVISSSYASTQAPAESPCKKTPPKAILSLTRKPRG